MNRAIFRLRNWLRWFPVDRHQAPALKPLLLASDLDEDYQTLQALLRDTKWSLTRALSWNDVSAFYETTLNPVVLVDRYFQGSNWQSTVTSFLDPAPNGTVILLSDVSDPYLWNELVQQGGFDVLARPFDRAELLRTLAFAQRHSTGDWPPLSAPLQQRHLPEGKPK